MANTHLAPDEEGESWDRVARFRDFEKQQAKTAPRSIHADSVKWGFVEIIDNLRPGQWVLALVRFQQGEDWFVGELQCDPDHPEVTHDDTIYEIEPEEMVIAEVEHSSPDAHLDDAGE